MLFQLQQQLCTEQSSNNPALRNISSAVTEKLRTLQFIKTYSKCPYFTKYLIFKFSSNPAHREPTNKRTLQTKCIPDKESYRLICLSLVQHRCVCFIIVCYGEIKLLIERLKDRSRALAVALTQFDDFCFYSD